jgi:hypothetical protein
VLEVPSVDCLRFHFCGAAQQECIINPAAGEVEGGGLFNGGVVFFFGQRDHGEAIYSTAELEADRQTMQRFQK